jgi:DNA-binding SARP family transcriptional activator
MRRQARAAAWAVALFASLAVTSNLAVSLSVAADLIWEVENPFRFFNGIFCY